MLNFRLSKILSGIMLGIFIVLLSFGVLLQIFDVSHLSYMFAFGISAVIFILFIVLFDKIKIIENIWILIGLCFLTNFIWILFFKIEPQGDYAIFSQYADLLSYNYGVLDYIALFPHIFGYSYFLSRFIRIFGSSELIAQIINVVLTTISGTIIWYLVKEHYGNRNAAVAFLLWILCPSKTIYNSMVLSEPFYTCLLLIFLLIVYISSNQEKIIVVSILGISAGIILRMINCARPIALIPIIACALWILLLNGFKGKNTIIFFALILIIYFPTGNIWNDYIDDFIGEEPSSGLPGYNIYVGLDSNHEGTHNDEDMDKFLEYYYGGPMTASQAQEAMLSDAVEMVKNGNVDFKRLFPSKLKTFLGDDESAAFYFKDGTTQTGYSILCILSNIWYYFIILLCIYSSVKLIINNPLNCLQLCPLYVIGLTLAHMIVEVSGRYHYSIIPMLIIVACSFKKKEGASV